MIPINKTLAVGLTLFLLLDLFVGAILMDYWDELNDLGKIVYVVFFSLFVVPFFLMVAVWIIAERVFTKDKFE